MKGYQKKKDKPNSPGPGYRTAKSYRGKQFGKQKPNANIRKTSFKTQHRG